MVAHPRLRRRDGPQAEQFDHLIRDPATGKNERLEFG
jgi:hypothetical protein